MLVVWSLKGEKKKPLKIFHRLFILKRVFYSLLWPLGCEESRMKYSILYYLIVWSRVLLNSDFKTTAQCPHPYNSTQGELLCYRDTVMTFVPEASALVTEAGAAVSAPARLSQGQGRSALQGSIMSPQALKSHSPFSVLIRTTHQPGYCVFKSLSSHNPMDCSPPASSVHRILQARILECIAMPSSRGSPLPRKIFYVSCIGRWVLYH